MSENGNILKLILEKAKLEPTTLVVFDLDSTLFNVSPRTQQIIADFPKGKPEFDHLLKTLESVKVKTSDWGAHEALQRVGIGPQHEAHPHIIEHWQDYFFSSDYLHTDKPFDGASQYVGALHQAGAHITYLTGREQKLMHEGTVKSLRQWGFPIDRNNVELIMKPHGNISDADFKKNIFMQLAGLYPDLYFFENEPVIIHLVQEHCPEVEIIFVDSVHSGQAEEPNNTHKIPMKYSW